VAAGCSRTEFDETIMDQCPGRSGRATTILNSDDARLPVGGMPAGANNTADLGIPAKGIELDRPHFHTAHRTNTVLESPRLR